MVAKTIFITGGGSGIGRAVAELFARRGWRVGLADVDRRGLLETQQRLPSRLASIYEMDVRNRAAWAAALKDFTRSNGGRLDFFFNNAGIGTNGALADNSDEDVDRIIGINLVGMINGARGISLSEGHRRLVHGQYGQRRSHLWHGGPHCMPR